MLHLLSSCSVLMQKLLKESEIKAMLFYAYITVMVLSVETDLFLYKTQKGSHTVEL